MLQNPDFARRADDITAPVDPKFGWGVDDDITAKIMRERKGEERLTLAHPKNFQALALVEPIPEVQKQWMDFQHSRGRFGESRDWSILDEFVLKILLSWLPQIIGSCVVSNTIGGWVTRLMYQIVFLGQPMEYLGRQVQGVQSYAFYGPWSYGAARLRGKMANSGDGLYCEAMVESALHDGFLACSTPALIELLKKLGHAGENDFPEPQDEALYRAFGRGQYIEQLRQYADYTVQECPYVHSLDELKAALAECKPTIHCSNVAIKKVGDHKDGFAIHAQDFSTSWGHNMRYDGYFFSSDGDLWFVLSNQSWGPKFVYNINAKEVDRIIRTQNPTMGAIGQIKGPMSAPPVIA